MIAIPACVVCVAPTAGRSRPVLAVGATVRRGDVVAVIATNGGNRPVQAPAKGRVGGVLTGRDQPVGSGEGVVWLTS